MIEEDKSNQHQKYARIYPLKKRWQVIYLVLGWWLWLCHDLLILLAERKAIPAELGKIITEEKRSYLRISDDGLEYVIWKILKMRFNWDDIKRIKKSPLVGDILFFERVEESDPGFIIFIGAPQIHLNSLVGWPDGGLEEDLRKYAPQLFEPQG